MAAAHATRDAGAEWQQSSGPARGVLQDRFRGLSDLLAEVAEEERQALANPMAGDFARLSYTRQLLTGMGPVTRRGYSSRATPLLICCYSGGFTSASGPRQLKYLLAAAKRAGFPDSLVLDHIGEPGLQGCKDWSEYIDRLAVQLYRFHPQRRVIIFAHSHGCLPAYGLAKRLGSRCLKLYVAGRRPPDCALLDDVWGVSSTAEVGTMRNRELLLGMLDAWPNENLEPARNASSMPKHVRRVMGTVRRQYGSAAVPTGSKDLHAVVGEAPAVEAPVLALAASDERPRGETAAKMAGWRRFTKSSFELKTVEGAHMGMLNKGSPLIGLVVADMRALVPSFAPRARL